MEIPSSPLTFWLFSLTLCNHSWSHLSEEMEARRLKAAQPWIYNSPECVCLWCLIYFLLHRSVSPSSNALCMVMGTNRNVCIIVCCLSFFKLWVARLYGVSALLLVHTWVCLIFQHFCVPIGWDSMTPTNVSDNQKFLLLSELIKNN